MLRGITARFFSIRFSPTYYVNHLRSRLYRWNSVLYYVLIFLDVRMQHSKRKRLAAVLSFFRWQIRSNAICRFINITIIIATIKQHVIKFIAKSIRKKKKTQDYILRNWTPAITLVLHFFSLVFLFFFSYNKFLDAMGLFVEKRTIVATRRNY